MSYELDAGPPQHKVNLGCPSATRNKNQKPSSPFGLISMVWNTEVYKNLQKYLLFSTKHNENEIKFDSEISVLIFSLSKYSNSHHSTDVFDVAHVFRL